MSEIYVKLSELSRPSTPVNDSDVVFISQLNDTENISTAMPISDLRDLLNFETAYDTTTIGLSKTKANQIFYVYTDSQKLSVNPYYNRNGIAEAITDSTGDKLQYTTLLFMQKWFTYYGYSLIKEVPSFAALRTLPVLVEGQKVKLRGYYENTDVGGGTFIGHIGTATDDGGVIASGSGFYWERANAKNSSIDIFSFGAKDNSIPDNESYDNRIAIQKTVDYANAYYLATGAIKSVYIPTGVFKVRSKVFTPTGASSSAGIISIVMKDGVRLYGDGTLKAFENHYGKGAFYRLIGSDSGAPVNNVTIEGITIDGQVANQVANTQASNIVLEAASNITILKVKSINANGNGIMVRGNTTTPVRSVTISQCIVDNVSMIGIQSSQFNGLSITGNVISNTADNGIDIYGDINVNASDSNGVNFSIVGNALSNIGMTGIFPETVANGTITGNSVYICKEGIHSNRIRSKPKNITISSNSITKSTRGGIIITGDHEGVTITGNTISDWTGAGFCFGTSKNGNVADIFAMANTFIPSSATVTIISVIAALASRIEVSNNFIRNNIGVPSTNFVVRDITTTAGVNIGSWAVSAVGVSTGTQMYRSASFTPTIKGSTVAGAYTYSTQSGTYVRIGNLVQFQARVVWTTGTGTGQLTLSGLPWAPSTTLGQPSIDVFFSGTTLTTYGQSIIASISSGNLVFSIQTQGNTTLTNVVVDSIATGTLAVKGFYFVD